MLRLSSMLLLISVGPAASVLLAPLRTPPRVAVGRSTASAIRLSAEEEILVGGQPIVEGDGLIVRDEESSAWWRATVRELQDGRVKVHFMGTDDSWDAWYDGNSPDLMRVDAAEANRPAFQSEELDLSLDDDELLEALRQKKWDANARWQLSTFAQTHLGEWVGAATTYTLTDDGLGMSQDGPPAACVTTAFVPADSVISWNEVLADAPLSLGNLTLTPDSFARTVGTMCVGGAYSISRDLASGASGAVGSEGAGLLLELGVAESGRRVRAKLLYAAPGGSGELSLQRLALLQETESSTPRSALSAADVSERVGSGLYDPPQGDRQRYQSLYCEGAVTLVFPRSLPAETPGFVSLDWTGPRLRYQVDRKFDRLDSSLKALELTEIVATDSESFPASFPGSAPPS